VTEPIEFTFIFLAPALFAVHAVLTGLAMVLMQTIHVRLGFSFSAGLFDYVLNFNRASRPLWLLPVGLVYFGVYYGLFRFWIARFDLKTPGRDSEASLAVEPVAAGRPQALAFITALGGAANLRSVDACTTRLRLTVIDSAAIDREALKRLGARGVVEPAPGTLQVVLGPVADQVASQIRAGIKGLAAAAHASPTGTQTVAPPALPAGRTDEFLAALGGVGNVIGLELGADRLLVHLRRGEALNEVALIGLGARGIARPGGAALQVLLGGAAEQVYSGLRPRLA